MRQNPLKQLWKNNRPAVNGWLTIPDTLIAEIFSEQDFDSITIDMQHGLIDYSGAVKMLQAMRHSGKPLLVRVPWLDAAHVMKILDAGADGIICPMINNRAQAESLVSMVRYPPRGTRSYGPVRANIRFGADYFKHANEEIVCLAMIETGEAMENLEEIVSTPGLDGIYIGPADLSLGIGQGKYAPGFDRKETVMVEAIEKILKAARKYDLKAGIHCGSPEYIRDMFAKGFHLASVSSDSRIFTQAVKSKIDEIRSLIQDTQTENINSDKDFPEPAY